MRVVTGFVNDVKVKAYPGSTSVLLAMDVAPPALPGLLGFAIERETLDGPKAGSKKWLEGLIHFPGQPHSAGQPIPTNIAPVQRFRWSDYTGYPGTRYLYTVHPVHLPLGTPPRPSGPAVEVRTLDMQAARFVIFNRAVAASQAFARRFPQVAADLEKARRLKKKPTTVKLPDEAYDWLSRGLLDSLVSFIAEARDETWALDIAIYEYELEAIRAALADAAKHGVQIRFLYHAKPGDPQTRENRTSLRKPPLSGSNVDLIPRKTSAIMHDKFIVLSRYQPRKRTPVAVLCGSTNFTENGVYRQGNVVHIDRDPEVAKVYLGQFEDLARTSEDPRQTRAAIDRTNPIVSGLPVFAGFSPRTGLGDLAEFVRIIDGAQRDVMFCTVFKLHDTVEKALLGKPRDSILRVGLQNSRSTITGWHRDRLADFDATAFLKDGLEGWLKESTAGQKGNILVHMKLVIADFTSDRPTVITGSHNLSQAASKSNDENFLILHPAPGDTDVADVYGVELLRFYDHYRFRWKLKEEEKKGRTPMLEPTDRWTHAYFGGDALKTADRICFAG